MHGLDHHMVINPLVREKRRTVGFVLVYRRWRLAPVKPRYGPSENSIVSWRAVQPNGADMSMTRAFN